MTQNRRDRDLTRSETGRLGEELTAYYLERSGYRILKRNFRIKGGEIDIIAEKGGITAFVEVKTRSESALETGAEAVNSVKKRLILRAAQEYMLRFPECGQPRFDIAEVIVRNGRASVLRYFDNAFDGGEKEFIL